MAHSSIAGAGRVGPFVVGASANDLMALAEQPDLGLSKIETHEQAQEYYRQRCEGLYAKAMAGMIPNFTGLDSPYEPPEAPELHLGTQGETAEREAERILETLERRRIIS